MVATVADSLEFEHKYCSIGDRVGARGPADRRRRGRAEAGPLLVDGGPAPGARRRCPRACHDCAVRPGDGQVEDPAPVRVAGHLPLVGVLHTAPAGESSSGSCGYSMTAARRQRRMQADHSTWRPRIRESAGTGLHRLARRGPALTPEAPRRPSNRSDLRNCGDILRSPQFARRSGTSARRTPVPAQRRRNATPASPRTRRGSARRGRCSRGLPRCPPRHRRVVASPVR